MGYAACAAKPSAGIPRALTQLNVADVALQQAAERPDADSLRDFLLKLPGVSPFNVRALCGGIRCVADVAAMSLLQLSKLMGSASATKLRAFLHQAAPPSSAR